MNMQAKPIVKNKFWIVEKDGEKVATIQSTQDGVVLVIGHKREAFPSIKTLSDRHNIVFHDAVQKEKKSEKHEVNGFPCKDQPYNELFDVKNNLPIYTKTEKSRSFYCAGFYIIQFENGWVKSHCPKLITLDRNTYQGPFKDKLEMQEQLRLVE